MIIDFHAHLYPLKIAAKASKAIGDFYDTTMTYMGLTDELIQSGSKIGVTTYVVHSAASTPNQVQSINNFIKGEVDKYPDLLCGYGTIHPDYVEFEAELDRITDIGLKGVKVHPDFQKFPIDDERMDPIYSSMEKRGLPLLIHAGDCRYDFSGPKRIANVLDKHPDLLVIAAHMGGYTEWDDSEKYLVGRNVYFDISSTFWKLPKDRVERMIKNHGVDKILFGSDFPMWDHQQEMERFNKLNLTTEERDAILYKNGAKILHL